MEGSWPFYLLMLCGWQWLVAVNLACNMSCLLIWYNLNEVEFNTSLSLAQFKFVSIVECYNISEKYSCLTTWFASWLAKFIDIFIQSLPNTLYDGSSILNLSLVMCEWSLHEHDHGVLMIICAHESFMSMLNSTQSNST